MTEPAGGGRAAGAPTRAPASAVPAGQFGQIWSVQKIG